MKVYAYQQRPNGDDLAFISEMSLESFNVMCDDLHGAIIDTIFAVDANGNYYKGVN